MHLKKEKKMFQLFQKKSSPFNRGKFSSKNFSFILPFKYKAGLIFIDVEIEDEKYSFLFDTGAFTILPSALIKKLSLGKMEEGLDTLDAFSEEKKLSLYQLPKLKIGELVFYDFQVASDDFIQNFPLSCLAFDGVLGYNFFHELIIGIDYESRTLTFSDKLPSLQGFTKIKLRTNAINTLEFFLQIEKQKIWMGLDTGSNGGLQFQDEKLAQILHKKKYKSQRIIGLFSSSLSGTNQQSFQDVFLLKNFSLAKKLMINSFPIRYEENSPNLAGNGFLKHFFIIIDFKTKKLYLKKREEIIQKVLKKSFGFFTFWSEENGLYISAIMQGTPAYSSKLKIGDRLFSIGTTETLNFTKKDYCNFSFLAQDIDYENEDSLELIVKRENKLLRILLIH